jgi:hypothetical protein
MEPQLTCARSATFPRARKPPGGLLTQLTTAHELGLMALADKALPLKLSADAALLAPSLTKLA